MRYSTNQEIKRIVKNGFDYNLQVWVKNYIIQHCGHHSAELYHNDNEIHCCNASKHAYRDIRNLDKE